MLGSLPLGSPAFPPHPRSFNPFSFRCQSASQSVSRVRSVNGFVRGSALHGGLFILRDCLGRKSNLDGPAVSEEAVIKSSQVKLNT